MDDKRDWIYILFGGTFLWNGTYNFVARDTYKVKQINKNIFSIFNSKFRLKRAGLQIPKSDNSQTDRIYKLTFENRTTCLQRVQPDAKKSSKPTVCRIRQAYIITLLFYNWQGSLWPSGYGCGLVSGKGDCHRTQQARLEECIGMQEWYEKHIS